MTTEQVKGGSPMKKAIAWGFGIPCGCMFFLITLFVCLMLLAGLSSTNTNSHSSKPSPPMAKSESVKTEDIAKPADAQEKTSSDPNDWKKVKEWKGKGMKETETFHIASKEWAIMWATKSGEYPANFAVLVYKEGGSIFDAAGDVAANVIGEDSNYSMMHNGPGDFHLQINTIQPYCIRIMAPN